ncbi:MAG: FAD-dependent oxidoreductase [Gammaproteobacteria bacterium]|nr:FAD-dependent oxidoreductase [Gammaproteobacteria bacterium]
MQNTVVIAGAGQAASQTIVSLRHGGFEGRIVLVGDEPYLPYQRPPLSKKFLAGELDVSRLLVRHEQFYPEHQVEVHLGTRVSRIEPGSRTAELSSGTTLHYDKLVLATGSRPRKIDVPGHHLPGVHYLRTIDDVERIRADFRPGVSLVIVGAGYIGLEVAAVAVSLGLKVTVIELADQVMARVEAPPVSAFMARVHREAGVEICCNTGLKAFTGKTRLKGVVSTDGREIPADLAIIGVGVLVNAELAQDAGIVCDNGIMVDEYCRTSDADVLAVGDCTNHPNTLLGRRLRLESVHNAVEQGKTAAATILGGLEPYAQVPWFWSDQYDLKLQIAGLSSRSEQAVIRGEPESRSFAAFFLSDDGRLTSVYAINSPREFMLSKKLIALGARPDPALLSDASVPFKEIAGALEN